MSTVYVSIDRNDKSQHARAISPTFAHDLTLPFFQRPSLKADLPFSSDQRHLARSDLLQLRPVPEDKRPMRNASSWHEGNLEQRNGQPWHEAGMAKMRKAVTSNTSLRLQPKHGANQ
ncbi:hypothetical protein TTRE_0000697501 [Trichuris trichiura]|uniref:Uncharacterized protein n=1 Tax=Trichuris trichiura TaxID=36087 RepID=A0A077ZE78_TRITR|nr:hypothetical protein TTRE_0000697501 [Trichuris trichiura]